MAPKAPQTSQTSTNELKHKHKRKMTHCCGTWVWCTNEWHLVFRWRLNISNIPFGGEKKENVRPNSPRRAENITTKRSFVMWIVLRRKMKASSKICQFNDTQRTNNTTWRINCYMLVRFEKNVPEQSSHHPERLFFLCWCVCFRKNFLYLQGFIMTGAETRLLTRPRTPPPPPPPSFRLIPSQTPHVALWTEYKACSGLKTAAQRHK